MAETATTPPTSGRRSASPPPSCRPRRQRLSGLIWLVLAAALVAGAVEIVSASRMRPGYDAFGWLVWGRQVLHWNLNTDGAPSWKPLPFVFTLPYALLGRQAQMWLWLATSAAGSLATAVFAGRVAFRLSLPAPGRVWAPWIGALFAAAAVLGIEGYSHEALIASSDPLVAALCLAAADAHLGRRPRLAFVALVLAALGRPEAWPFALLYGLWAWRGARRLPWWALLPGLALIPAFWFVIPALTSKSWFTPGSLALRSVNAVNVIHGDKLTGLLGRFAGLYSLPMRIGVLAAVAIGLLRRDLRILGLAGAGALWVAVELAFVLHGWSGAARYLFEPAALAVALVGAAVGRALAFAPGPTLPVRLLGTAAGTLAVVALVVALVPTARAGVREDRSEVAKARDHGTQVDRLEQTVARIGGVALIRSCGQPTTLVGLQSMVAWEMGLNVGNVGFRPGRAIKRGEAVVVLKPLHLGWQVRPWNAAPRCASLTYPPKSSS